MESWKEDRIWVWLIAASKNYSDVEQKVFIDLVTKTFFLQKNNEGSLTASDRYFEFPAMDDSFPLLTDPNAHIFSNKKEDIEKMNDNYRRMKYAQKVLEDIGLAFDKLKGW